MARLKSEDNQCISYLELLRTGPSVEYRYGEKTQIWDPVTVSVTSGTRSLANQKAKNWLFCRSPQDEVKTLIAMLKDCIKQVSDKVLFEPHEPFMELLIERSENHGLKVEAWLDAGSDESGIYTWDAMGIRFQTTIGHLEDFTKALQVEFA